MPADVEFRVGRGTRTVGVQGPESRVDAYTAIWLYTAAGRRAVHDPDGLFGAG
jgi:predicted amidohydrolase YtcJ